MKEEKWKLLKRKEVFKTRIVTVYQDRVLLPNGKIIPDYTIVTKPSYVKIVPIDKKGRVLMQREYRHAVDRYMWETPGGMMEKGESPIDVAKRELAEETGYTKGNFKFMGIISDYGSTDTHTGYIVRASNISGRRKPQQEDTESIGSIRFFSVPAIKRMVMKGELENSSALASLILAGVFF